MGHIIYVGKAKNLANRVRSYFHTSAKDDERLQPLLRQIDGVDFLFTPSETEALLQEYRLIKQHKPWFNSQLKRETPHPFIRIDTGSEYPSISIANDAADDDAEYFGSFFDIYDAKEAIETFNSMYRTPLCMKPKLPSTACLYRSIGRCAAPCEGAIPQAAYRTDIMEVMALLRGEQIAALDSLGQEIDRYLRALEFEKAATAEKKLAALEKLRRKGRKLFRLQGGSDAAVLVRAYRTPECVLLNIRSGVVVNLIYVHASVDDCELTHRIEQCLHEDSLIAEETWLTSCVTEIIADKLFVQLSQEMSCEELIVELQSHIKDFLA